MFSKIFRPKFARARARTSFSTNSTHSSEETWNRRQSSEWIVAEMRKQRLEFQTWLQMSVVAGIIGWNIGTGLSDWLINKMKK